MSRKVNILFFIIFSIYITAFSQTIIPGGNVSGIWTATGSPYNVQGNITIQADSTLAIEPGVEVNFQGNYAFAVNGFLQAAGTSTDSIHFTATTDWGGITFTNAPDSSHLIYCTVSECYTINSAVYCNNSNVVITHCAIENNSALLYGAIFLYYSNSCITNCTIKDNKCSGYGSCINILNSTPEISNCDIFGNGTTASRGGGIYCALSTAYISQCNIIGNIANHGGGIYVDAGGHLIISNSSISYNTAYQGAGIAFLNGSSGTISNCIIDADSTTNYATAQGAGILISSSSGVFTISNTTISNCWSSYGGSGIHIDNAASVLITGSTFDSNICFNSSTVDVGAIYSANCTSLVIDHCNLVKNYSSWFAGGITLNGSTNLTLTNSIFRSHYERDITFANYSSASVSYCDFYGASGPFVQPPPGLGTLVQTNANGDSCDVFYNIYLDPLFVDFTSGDYHLTGNSPCIDAGDPASPYDPDGTITDMGRYFFDQGGTGVPGGYVSGTWTAAGSPYRILGNITVHADSTLTIEPGVEVIFQGFYSFQVNGALEAIGTEIDSISFFAADTSIGWRGIRLDAAADVSWISYASIRHGRNTDGGGIYCASPNATITYCTIAHNKASNNGGGVCIFNGITNPPPVINNCVISRNSARFGGGVFYVADSMNISDCLISNNAAQDPSGDTRGGGLYFDGGFSSSIYINNCTIQNNSCESDSLSGNSLQGLGGGLYIHGRNGGGTFISNCQILSNWARRSGGGIFRDLGGVEISDCTIRGNFTKFCTGGSYTLIGGGAIGLSFLNFNSFISRCEISENSGMGYAGGAIRAYNQVNASLTLENCTVSNNYSWISVGAIYISGTLYIKNSIVTFNKSRTHAGGIDANNATVSFCDFLSNDGPDIYGAPGGFGTLTTTNANGDSCDVYSNVFLDPLFGDTTSSNYQLTWANWPVSDSTRSPAIDAGDPASSHDPDSTVADMGALYFNQLYPIVSISDTTLDFGIVDIGHQLDLPLTIRNDGTVALRLQNVSNQNSVFTHNWNQADSLILSGDSLTITVTFTPADTNLTIDTLLIENNHHPLQVQLIGKGKFIVGIEGESELPKVYALYPAFPNPFNPVAHISFDLPRACKVGLIVYDILGRKVSTLVNQAYPAGHYEITWDARNLPSGLYFYRLEAGEYIGIRKVILMK